jgi:bis(5'-nucleosyl)-tetraphosphatase (symmetrical)
MAHYAIGDIHGCYDQLIQLLDKIQFSPHTDTLWLTGDLVSRGPKSLETLRFVSQLPQVVMTLGNHDLRLLTYAFNPKKRAFPNHTLEEILKAPDLFSLCHWLRKQPLLHYDATLNFVLVHAGLAPQWRLDEAISYAEEVESTLQGENYIEFLRSLPKYLSTQTHLCWQPQLNGYERLGCIINYFTRMRFCDKHACLDLTVKDCKHPSKSYYPWFQVPNRKNQALNILFGHWAALQGKTGVANVHALDTGCDYGYCLTALRLEDRKRISIKCPPSTRSALHNFE